MKAVIRRNKQLVCDEIGELTPGEGQVLVHDNAPLPEVPQFVPGY